MLKRVLWQTMRHPDSNLATAVLPHSDSRVVTIESLRCRILKEVLAHSDFLVALAEWFQQSQTDICTLAVLVGRKLESMHRNSPLAMGQCSKCGTASRVRHFYQKRQGILVNQFEELLR